MISTRRARQIRRGINMARIVADQFGGWGPAALWHYIDVHRSWVPTPSRRAYDFTAVKLIKERFNK